MNGDTAFVSAFEYEFELGCHIPNIESMNLAPDESIYRALYIFPFHPLFVTDIHTSGDMAKIQFHMEKSGFKWSWVREVIAAFENDLKPSDNLPESYIFSSTKVELSKAQFQWFKDHISTLPFETFISDAPGTGCERDGEHLRGRVAGAVSKRGFDLWRCAGRNKEIEPYFLLMFQLACSVVEDTESRAELLQIQRYFYGYDGRLYKDFVFPLIANS